VYKSQPVFYPFYLCHNIAQYLETHHFVVAEVQEFLKGLLVPRDGNIWSIIYIYVPIVTLYHILGLHAHFLWLHTCFTDMCQRRQFPPFKTCLYTPYRDSKYHQNYPQSHMWTSCLDLNTFWAQSWSQRPIP
jgi:hypothetical protein